jgi:hypothetical protein
MQYKRSKDLGIDRAAIHIRNVSKVESTESLDNDSTLSGERKNLGKEVGGGKGSSET